MTLDTEIPEVRPGFTCTAEITTATRKNVVSVPIQATTVREMVVDEKGDVVRENRRRLQVAAAGAVQASELKPGQSRKELEGVFVVRDNKAQFVPVKTGIAGDKYFEVLSGVKDGDNVVIGPFASVRELTDNAPVKIEAPTDPDDARSRSRFGFRAHMNQFLEAVGIALNAIWTNKLRSFLTVLGNIVAVTSIIAVVSLIQGMNAYVTDAIVSDVGADTFTIQRTPVVRSADDEDRVRSNPRMTVQDGDAVRRFSENVNAVAAQANNDARIAYQDVAARLGAGPGRVARLHLLLDLQRRARPADQPDRGRPQPGR